MAIQMRRGNLADFDPTKMMPGEFAVTLDTDNNLNKRALITFAAGTVKRLMTVEDATAQMIEATDAATAEAEAWAHGNSFTATEMFTSAGSATVTLAYSPSSINAVKINDVATTAYTHNDKVITFNTAPAVGSIITVIYGVSTSTDNAKYYKEQADTSATSAATNAVAAESYAVGGTGSRTGEDTDNAKYYKEQADLSADDADDYAILAESYAVGGTGTRPGEDSDNAEYYYEQARDISQSLTGALKPCGTVTYVNLPSLSVALVGDMYNVSDEFTTTNDFKEGAGHHINAGANVYKTIDNKWDILAGVTVTGVKGDKEQNYRQGNINLTPANIGAVDENTFDTTIESVYSVMGQMGAKNLFNSQYSAPRTNAETTATLGDDGHVIINGTANADAAQLNRPGKTIEPINGLKVGDKLILSYKVISGTFTHGSSSNNTTLYFNNKNGSAVDPINFPSSLSAGDSDSKEITLTDVCFTDGILNLKDIQIYMRSGDTFNNLELAIMLRLASDTDNTYQPYAKTNKQLTDDKAEVVSVRDYVNELGVKNLLVPKWAETLTTENGVTYTFNADGTIVMNTDASGATANTNCNLRDRSITTNNLFPAGSYILTGCPTGGELNKYRTWVRAYRPNTNTALTENLYDEGNGVSFTVSEPFSLGINATVFKDYVCNNLTWKPMLRLASDINDDTYVPYAMTNKQLTDEIGDLSQTGLAGDSVAEQLDTAREQITQLNTALNGKCSITTYNWNIGSVTAGSVYTLDNFKSTVGLSNKNIVAVGLVYVAGSADYDYEAAVIFRNTYDFARVKFGKTQSSTTVGLYIIYTD